MNFIKGNDTFQALALFARKGKLCVQFHPSEGSNLTFTALVRREDNPEHPHFRVKISYFFVEVCFLIIEYQMLGNIVETPFFQHSFNSETG